MVKIIFQRENRTGVETRKEKTKKGHFFIFCLEKLLVKTNKSSILFLGIDYI